MYENMNSQKNTELHKRRRQEQVQGIFNEEISTARQVDMPQALSIAVPNIRYVITQATNGKQMPKAFVNVTLEECTCRRAEYERQLHSVSHTCKQT